MIIISGGQSGVDRAALDVARKCKINHGGWCPQGRLAEDISPLPSHYHLQETSSTDPNVRTEKNVDEADATLILLPNKTYKMTSGTLFTVEYAIATKNQYLILSLAQPPARKNFIHWLSQYKVQTLNIAGPRESKVPGIYQLSYDWLISIFEKS